MCGAKRGKFSQKTHLVPDHQLQTADAVSYDCLGVKPESPYHGESPYLSDGTQESTREGRLIMNQPPLLPTNRTIRTSPRYVPARMPPPVGIGGNSINKRRAEVIQSRRDSDPDSFAYFGRRYSDGTAQTNNSSTHEQKYFFLDICNDTFKKRS